MTNLRKAVHPFRLLRNDKFFVAYLLLLFVLSPAAFKCVLIFGLLQVLVTNLKKEKEELNKQILSIQNEKVQIQSTVEKLTSKIEHVTTTHENETK